MELVKVDARYVTGPSVALVVVVSLLVSACSDAGSAASTNDVPLIHAWVVETAPLDGTAGVAPDLDSILVTLNEPVPPQSVAVELVPLGWLDGRPFESDPPIPLIGVAGEFPRQVQFSPIVQLSHNRQYMCRVTDGVTDNNVQLSPKTVMFATGALEPFGIHEATSGFVIGPNGPVSGARIRCESTEEIAITNAEGRFELKHVPVGHQVLEVNAFPQDALTTYATLHFPIIVEEGYAASFRRPIHLPRLDLDNAVAVDDGAITVLTSPLIPGFELVVEPGSARFPDGSVPSVLSVTEVSVETPPMGPPAGRAFEQLVTIQPPGVIFDPPARVTYPAPGGSSVGDEIPLVHYDGGAQRWVAFGKGRVIEEGGALLLRSFDGCGVIRTAWQAPSPETVYTDVTGLLDDDCIDQQEALALSRALYAAAGSSLQSFWAALGWNVARYGACMLGVPTDREELRDMIIDELTDDGGDDTDLGVLGFFGLLAECGGEFWDNLVLRSADRASVFRS